MKITNEQSLSISMDFCTGVRYSQILAAKYITDYYKAITNSTNEAYKEFMNMKIASFKESNKFKDKTAFNAGVIQGLQLTLHILLPTVVNALSTKDGDKS